MRRTLYFLTAFMVASLFTLNSCEEQNVAPVEESLATIEFALFDAPEDELINARKKDGHHPWELLPECQDDAIAAVAVTINGFAYKLIPKWFAEVGWQVQLPLNQPGTYEVTELMLLDEEDEVLFATPAAGSAFAPFVKKPVPFKFEIVNAEKVVNKADVICFCPSDLPNFGIKILEFDRCVIFKNFWFANLCDDYGHHEARISGGLYFPDTEYFIEGGYAHGFFYTYAKACLDDYEDTVWIILEVATDNEVRYYRVPVPSWLLYYYKNYVVHINDDCDGMNICRQEWAIAAAEELEIEGFNPDDYEPEEIDQATYEYFMGLE